MYNGKELSECFANLHMTFDKEIQKVNHEMARISEKVNVLDSNAQLVNDDLQNIHNAVVPNLEETISDETKERLKLEIWGRKWNLVIGGIEGGLEEKPRETETKVRGFFQTMLRMSLDEANSVLLQACHRLPGGDEKKRRVIIRLNSLMVRDEILSKAMKFQRGCGYSVVPDVPPSVSVLRSKLLQRRRELEPADRRKTKLVYMKEYPFVSLRTK